VLKWPGQLLRCGHSLLSVWQLVVWLQVARTDWVLKWPGQLVIAGCQTFWTAEVSDALEHEDLDAYVPKLLSQVHFRSL